MLDGAATNGMWANSEQACRGPDRPDLDGGVGEVLLQDDVISNDVVDDRREVVEGGAVSCWMTPGPVHGRNPTRRRPGSGRGAGLFRPGTSRRTTNGFPFASASCQRGIRHLERLPVAQVGPRPSRPLPGPLLVCAAVSKPCRRVAGPEEPPRPSRDNALSRWD